MYTHASVIHNCEKRTKTGFKIGLININNSPHDKSNKEMPDTYSKESAQKP